MKLTGTKKPCPTTNLNKVICANTGISTMSNLTQKFVNPNNQPLMIGEFLIHQDEDGRYSLADLHKASGNLAKHKPSNFLRVEQTQELIKEIEQVSDMSLGENNHFSDMRSAVKVINGGNQRGTYAVKEMVYSYAMWISAKFHLMVIRAYDSLVMKFLGEKSERPKIEDKTTKQERVPLKDAVNLLVAKSKFLNYPDAYGLIHQRFDVKHIEDIPHEQISAAVEYVHRLIGEYLPKVERIDPEQKAFELLASDTTNKVNDYIYALGVEIQRLKGKLPDFPIFDKETIARAVITRIVQGQRMLLTVGYQTGKPEIQFIPSNAWILDDENIAKIIGDRDGPKKELLPDIVQAAMSRLVK